MDSAVEPSATAVMTTPWACGSSCKSSASAGERLATVAPANGECAWIETSSRGVSGKGCSATQRHLTALAKQADLRLTAERLGGEAIVESVRILDRNAVDADQEIAGFNARTPGGAVGHDARHQRAARHLEAQAIGDVGRNSCSWAPSQGRLTTELPLSAEATTTRTRCAGMAKPMPSDPPDDDTIALLMPIKSPVMSTSAPPELPGLIAASVWMKNW